MAVTIRASIVGLAALVGTLVAAVPAMAEGLAFFVGNSEQPGNSGRIQGAAVCILSVQPASREFDLYGHNISLLRPVTTDQTGHGRFNFSHIHVHSAPEYQRFQGAIRMRAHKDGYCADERTLEYGGNTIFQSFQLRPIPEFSSETLWCGSMNGLRCDSDPQDRIRPQPPTVDLLPGDVMPTQPGQPQLPSPTTPRTQSDQPGLPGTGIER